MFNVESNIVKNTDYIASVYNRFTYELVCYVHVVGDMGFIFDDDGFIDESFSIEDSGICSHRSKVNLSHIVNLDPSEILIKR